MFEKILVANRGEIAMRIIRACRELNIKTVAVYSKADANSMHVQVADEAICIGDSPSSESYLRIDRLISAAEITDVDAYARRNRGHERGGFAAFDAGLTLVSDDATSNQAATGLGFTVGAYISRALVFAGRGSATLDAQAPLALAARLQGQARAAIPQGHAQTLDLQAEVVGGEEAALDGVGPEEAGPAAGRVAPAQKHPVVAPGPAVAAATNRRHAAMNSVVCAAGRST